MPPAPRDGLASGDDGKARCFWGASDPLYLSHHEREWGFPVADDTRLFEKLCLEGFQAGLAWITILRKREAFRSAFKGFEPEAVARMNARSVERLLRDPGIVRHRGKIESTLQNARRYLELRDEFIGDWIRGHEWKPNVSNFIQNLLADVPERAITRDMEWGVPIPPELAGDETGKVLYVWFDAPIGYVSFT